MEAYEATPRCSSRSTPDVDVCAPGAVLLALVAPGEVGAALCGAAPVAAAPATFHDAHAIVATRSSFRSSVGMRSAGSRWTLRWHQEQEHHTGWRAHQRARVRQRWRQRPGWGSACRCPVSLRWCPRGPTGSWAPLCRRQWVQPAAGRVPELQRPYWQHWRPRSVTLQSRVVRRRQQQLPRASAAGCQAPGWPQGRQRRWQWGFLQTGLRTVRLQQWRQGLSMVLAALRLAVLLGRALRVLLQESWRLRGHWRWEQLSGRGGLGWLPGCQRCWLLQWETLRW
jgi:hypothetical protein